MSENGRYLLVVPKLSAMRVLDLRTGIVMSRLTYNNNEKSNDNNNNNNIFNNINNENYNSGYNNNNNNNNNNINSNNMNESNLIRNAMSTGSFSSLGQSRSRSSSNQRTKRQNINPNPPFLKSTHTHVFNVSKYLNGQQNRQASFCSGHSVVVTPGGTGTGYGIGGGRGGGGGVGGTGGGGGVGGTGVGVGNGVQLWNAESGIIMRSLSLCCGGPVQSTDVRTLHTQNKLQDSFNSHISYPSERTVASVQYRGLSSSKLQQRHGVLNEEMNEEDIDKDKDDIKERDRDTDNNIRYNSSGSGIAFPKLYDVDTHTDCTDKYSTYRAASDPTNDRILVQSSDMINSNKYDDEYNKSNKYNNNDEDIDNNDTRNDDIDNDLYRQKKYGYLEERNYDNDQYNTVKDKNDDDTNVPHVPYVQNTYVQYDPQLLLLASSPVFSTHYDDMCGVLGAASSAGITLWG